MLLAAVAHAGGYFAAPRRPSSPGNFSRMPPTTEPPKKPTPTFKQTLISVMAAQVLWILLLLLLQMHYSG